MSKWDLSLRLEGGVLRFVLRGHICCLKSKGLGSSSRCYNPGSLLGHLPLATCEVGRLLLAGQACGWEQRRRCRPLRLPREGLGAATVA